MLGFRFELTSHKLTSITLGSWWESIGYDSALRKKTFASPAGTNTYNFNGAGMQVESLTMPQNTETYTYNAVGALKLKQFKKGGTVLDSHDYGYNPDEMIQDVTRLGGVKVDYGYDNIGQLTSAKGKEADGTTLRLNEQLGYGYDASHNLAVRTNATLIQTFTSDSRNQLASVLRNGTLTSAGSVVGAVATLGVNGKQAAIYGDKTFATTEGITLANGTNVFVTTGSNSAGALVISTLEKAVLPVTVNCTYDLNGNITSDGLKGFEYDDANQLTRITQTNAWKSEFSYDGLGRRRIQRDYSYLPASSSYLLTNEVRYVYDGMAVLQERDGNNAELVTYTRGLDLSGTMQGAGGIGGLLARTEHSATSSLLASSSYYHSDAGGNITAMTDSSGNVVAKYLYDPFGNLLAKSGAMADVNRYRFSSKEVHLNSGSYYYGYRFYEPNFQRWLNEDPIREEGGMNLFGFVDNDPVNWFDTDGLSKQSRGGSGGGMARPPPTRGSGPGGRFTQRDFEREVQRQRELNQFQRNAEWLERERALERMFPGHKPGQTYLCAKGGPRGGVYGLFNQSTGEMMRSGRSSDLASRRSDHANDPTLCQFQFRPLFRTDNYAAQRGLEQMVHTKYNPPLNSINGISPTNPNRHNYVNAAEIFIGGPK